MSLGILPHSTLIALLIASPSALNTLSASAAEVDTTSTPYAGVTYITRTGYTTPRSTTANLHILSIDLTAPGISFGVTTQSGTRETTRQTTTDFVNQQNAVAGINVAFFNPVTTDPNVYLAGLVMNHGTYTSNFDNQPCSAEFPTTNQSYAIVPYAPAINIDPNNRPSVVHRDASFSDNQHVLENVTLWNAVSGSAQIITDGTVSIPQYQDASHPNGLLLTGTSSYSNSNSWYNASNARTAIGFTQDGNTLILFTVDNAGGSNGMTVGEVANILKNDYHCYEALNLDGGGSAAISLRNPSTGTASIVNTSSDNPLGRAEGANFAVFANPVPEPASMGILILGGAMLLVRRRKV